MFAFISPQVYITVWYSIPCHMPICHMIPYYNMLYYTVRYYIAPYYTLLYHNIQCCILFRTICHMIPYYNAVCTILYNTTSHHTVLYSTIIYYTHYTLPQNKPPCKLSSTNSSLTKPHTLFFFPSSTLTTPPQFPPLIKLPRKLSATNCLSRNSLPRTVSHELRAQVKDSKEYAEKMRQEVP